MQQEVNRLQGQLLAEGIIALMPTGIDELRFEQRSLGTRRYLTGRLNARWPCDSLDSTLYNPPPGAQDYDYEDLLLPRIIRNGLQEFVPEDRLTSPQKRELSSSISVLGKTIEGQIPSRDFLHIYCAKGLLVYRPFYGECGSQRQVFKTRNTNQSW